MHVIGTTYLVYKLNYSKISIYTKVIILLHIAWWLVHRVWRSGDDPDSVAIPYLTAFGDLIGIGLLTVAFQILTVAKAP